MQALINHYHLNDPWPIRYVVYLGNLIQGDWGWSRSMGQPVLATLGARFPATMELAITAIIWTLLAGIPFGKEVYALPPKNGFTVSDRYPPYIRVKE
jgi:peptide/nickel transport system permease protein